MSGLQVVSPTRRYLFLIDTLFSNQASNFMGATAALTVNEP